MQKLSIVIPCYNCADTLEEAVRSCYTQNVEIPFEIIMVDDGSTDGTRQLMEKLATEHAEIEVFPHEKNRGGGEARNTGIRHSTGTLIYCLDSDNFFGEGTLGRAIKYIEKIGADGVIFAEQRFFHGSNPKKYTSLYSTHSGLSKENPLTLARLFDGTEFVIDNFLFTRASYDKTAGYPEHHGFDTQGFEVRYLAAGNTIVPCPDTVFYHRMMPQQPSYFERSYNNGEFSLNYFLIFEDIFGRLTPEAQKIMIEYDIFRRCTMKDNLMNELKKLGADKKLLVNDSATETSYMNYGQILKLYRNNNYKGALDLTTKTVAASQRKLEDVPTLYYMSLRCKAGIAGTPHNEMEKNVKEYALSMYKKPPKLFKLYLRSALVRKMIEWLHKIKKPADEKTANKNSQSRKNYCIINYADGIFLKGQERLKRSLQDIDFKGDMLFFDKLPPNCPPHEKVPWGFKVYAFMEAVSKGYDGALWVDAAGIVVRPLDSIFKIMEKDGVFVFSRFSSTVGAWSSDLALQAMKISRKEAFSIPEISGFCIGINFKHEKGRAFLAEWRRLADDGITFLGVRPPYTLKDSMTNSMKKDGSSMLLSDDPRVMGHRHDQTAASVVACRLNLKPTKRLIFDLIGEGGPHRKYATYIPIDTLIVHNRDIKKESYLTDLSSYIDPIRKKQVWPLVRTYLLSYWRYTKDLLK